MDNNRNPDNERTPNHNHNGNNVRDPASIVLPRSWRPVYNIPLIISNTIDINNREIEPNYNILEYLTRTENTSGNPDFLFPHFNPRFRPNYQINLNSLNSLNQIAPPIRHIDERIEEPNPNPNPQLNRITEPNSDNAYNLFVNFMRNLNELEDIDYNEMMNSGVMNKRITSTDELNCLTDYTLSLLAPTTHTCSICLDTIEERSTLCMTNCGHSYHKECLLEWANKKRQCPVCKKEI